MSRTTRTSNVLNTVLGPVLRGHRNHDAAWAKAVEQAEAEIGGEDREFAEGLGRALASIAEEPRMTPLGYVFALGAVKGRYANRLRINRVLAEHPEVADEPITAPVFVLGLPRTATTLAHRILAASAEHRGPLLWELQHTALEDQVAGDKLARRMDKGMRTAVRQFAPLLEHIHPMDATQPEESLMLLPHGLFWSTMYGSLPSYREWYGQRSRADLAGDYAYLKQGLQVLQHGRPRKRWVLKYPGHLDDMVTIKEVFPDATFVWCHRDPASVIGSTCSLLETMWAMYQKDPDPLEIGGLALETMVTWVEHGLESRLALPPSSVVDVPYHRMSADPHAEVPRLYAAIGATWTASDEAQLDRVVARPPGTRPHQYGLSRYGLRPEQVDEAFATYRRLLGTFDVLDARPAADL